MGDNGVAVEAADGPDVPGESEAAGPRVTGGICHGVHLNPFTDLVKDLRSCGAAIGRGNSDPLAWRHKGEIGAPHSVEG